ncbi:MAG: hypothetical protein A2293_16505 [Elusimicrobia bacterium RIFOXYB2_FULL_49_7]|nr:MAG: hypothetical protein A2293_16505 [Elusimicrobia bacterium RIFOXYB2_FULL_49_7]
MKTYLQPDNDPETERLLSLLKGMTPPDKSDNEWLTLENRLMSDLARLPRKTLPLNPKQLLTFFVRPFPKPVMILSLLLLIGATVFLSIRNREQETLNHARIFALQGDVEYSVQASSAVDHPKWNSALLRQPISKGLSFRLPKQGDLAVCLDSSTGWRLLENSHLSIVRSDQKQIELYLGKGTIFCKVAKRKPGERFIVTTPNAICEVVGTRFKVEATEVEGKPYTLLTVIEGVVAMRRLSDKGPGLMVAAHTMAAIQGDRPFTSPSIDSASLQREMALLEAMPNPAAEKRTSGFLQISSEPVGATVMINGKPSGHTPFSIEKSAGEQTLSVTSPGYTGWHRTLQLTKNSTLNEHVVLQKITFLKLLKNMNTPTPLPLLEELYAENTDPTQFTSDQPGNASLLCREYQVGLDKIQIGNYSVALSTFETLRQKGLRLPADRIQLLEQIARCYRGLNDYSSCLATLSEIFNLTENPVKKDNLLWEMASLRAFYLSDYAAVEKDLNDYISLFPQGLWIQEARLRLAEIRYLLRKPMEAAEAYESYLAGAPEGTASEKAMYNLAFLLSHDLNNCEEAIRWYGRQMADYPGGLFLEDAIFWRADCLERLDRRADATREYQHYLSAYPNGRWKNATMERLENIGISRR